MNFLITNLFVGVVVSAYNREKEKYGGVGYQMSEDQR